MAEIIYDQSELVGRRFKIKVHIMGETLNFNLGDVEYQTKFQQTIEKYGFEYWKFLQEQPKEKKNTVDNIEDLAEKIKCARILYLSKEYQQRLARFEKLAQRNDLEGDLLTKVRTYLNIIALRDKGRCSVKNLSSDYVLTSEDRFQCILEQILKEIEK